MSDKIGPALSAEEWKDRVLDSGIALFASGGVSLGGEVFVDPADAPPLIAMLNHILPDSDKRKIKGLWTRWLREEADVLRRNGAGAGALMADEIAAALESYLPPRS